MSITLWVVHYLDPNNNNEDVFFLADDITDPDGFRSLVNNIQEGLDADSPEIKIVPNS